MRLSFLLKVFGLTPITFAAAVLEISFSTMKLLSFRYGEIALRGITYPAPFQYQIVLRPLFNVAELPYVYMIALSKVPVNNIFVISRKF